MMWWAMWCAAVLVGSAASAPASDAMPPLDLAQIDPSTSDDESISYGVPPMGTRYDNSAAPWLYLLAEMPRESQSPDESERARVKRRMPSLSIDLPMSLLRQRLTQEKERRVHALRAVANRNFLNDIGKRGETSERRPRMKRKMPSLSINNPMEVLRQRLMQEVVRKQMREANQRQAFANRLFLQNVGKRGFWANSGSHRYDE